MRVYINRKINMNNRIKDKNYNVNDIVIYKFFVQSNLLTQK